MSSLPSFPPLANPTGSAGAYWHLTAEGDAISSRNKGMVVVAKDISGDAQVPLVNAANHLIVDNETEDVVDLQDEGDNSGSASFVTLATIVTQTTTVYKNLDWVVACFREATMEIVAIDDVGGSPVETILATIKVGSGSFTDSNGIRFRHTSGSTGTQNLIIRGINLNALSQMEASLSIEEVQ